VIIVDDCSLEPLAVREHWKAHAVAVIRNEHNIGPGGSRQRGMRMSKGAYLAFLDADDWWSPTFMEHCLNTLSDHPDAAAAWVQSEVYQKDGSVKQRRYSEHPFTNLQETALQYARPWQTGSLLWRRSCCGEWGSLSTNQDYRFEFSSSLKCNTVAPVGEVLYHVDQRLGNHRTDLVKHEETVRNQFDLHKYVFDAVYKTLSKKSRFLLFHRVIRSMLKVTEHCQADDIKHYWILTEQMYPITVVMARQPFFLKVIHHLLQRTSYRLYL
jgi:glycosyltransferase involved in cell wall biosynthesis